MVTNRSLSTREPKIEEHISVRMEMARRGEDDRKSPVWSQSRGFQSSSAQARMERMLPTQVRARTSGEDAQRLFHRDV